MSLLQKLRITLFRFESGEFNENGIWVPGTQELIPIRCTVQPATPEDLQSLPEGRRQSRAFRIFTRAFLRAVATKNPDQVQINGERYELLSVQIWQNNIINHYTAIAVRLDDQPSLDPPDPQPYEGS